MASDLLHAVLEENAVLARELGRAQARSSRLATDIVELTQEAQRLRAQLLRLRAELIVKDSLLAYVRDDLATLQATVREPAHALASRVLLGLLPWRMASHV